METNESNFKPQPTGGLKLMTVFIAVLALHVVVIGGFTVWHLLNPASGDDLALDKVHKGAKVAADASLSGDVASTDTASIDKPAAPTPATPDNAAAIPPATTADMASASTTPVATTAPASAPASVALVPKPSPVVLDVTPPPAAEGDTSSIAANPAPKASSGPVQHGPVINPPDSLAAPDPSENVAAASSADSSAPVANGTPYTVKKGDSLARIAHRHHVALAQLKTANSLSSDKLSIGQKLVIPNHATKLAVNGASAPSATPVMTSADSSAPVDANEIETASTAPVTPSQAVALAAMKHAHTHLHKAGSSHHLYTVVRGDTLTRIARKFRTTPNAIMAANNITNASRLSIGKKLRIPSGESRNAAADSAPSEAPSKPETRHAAHGQFANYIQ